MQVSISIIRYRKRYILFAFLAMMIFRLPLWLNKNISFYKLLGSGKNGGFDKIPDLQQWGILLVRDRGTGMEGSGASNDSILKALYGRFLAGWFRFFSCEIWTVFLQPLEARGSWDGKRVFGELMEQPIQEGRMAILTRATIRFNKLKYFWQNVAPVTAALNDAEGLITSVGIGEIPWIQQGTFSVWESKNAMKAFAYGMKTHTEVIKKTRDQDWYSEEMFVRFKITGSSGTLKGMNPLGGKE